MGLGGCGVFGVQFRLSLPALALGGFGYLVVYTLLAVEAVS